MVGAWVADLYNPSYVQADDEETKFDANREYLDVTFGCIVDIKEIQL
jgi:hypothetical protein